MLFRYATIMSVCFLLPNVASAQEALKAAPPTTQATPTPVQAAPVQPGNTFPGQAIQPGQWGPWQPAQPGGIIQTDQWGQWQPIPGQPIPSGQWGPWQPVQPGGIVPGQQGPLPPSRVVYKTVQKQVRVYNSATGRYEIQIVEEVVPVQIGGTTPGGTTPGTSGNRFLVTVVNSTGGPVNFSFGAISQRMLPGASMQVWATEGQTYSGSGEPREVAPGQWVGGGAFQGTMSSSVRRLELGNPQPTVPSGPSGNGLFTVNFFNSYSSPVRVLVYDQNNTQTALSSIQPGQSFSTSVKIGYSYVQEGPVVYRNGGAVSGTRRGTINNRVSNITLGG